MDRDPTSDSVAFHGHLQDEVPVSDGTRALMIHAIFVGFFFVCVFLFVSQRPVSHGPPVVRPSKGKREMRHGKLNPIYRSIYLILSY